MADKNSELSAYKPSDIPTKDLQESCLAHLINIADIQYKQIFNDFNTDAARKHAQSRKNRLFHELGRTDLKKLGNIMTNVNMATCYFKNPKSICEKAMNWFREQDRRRETAKEGDDAAQDPGSDEKDALQAAPPTLAMEATPSRSRPSTREGEEAVAPLSAPAPEGGEDRGDEPMQVEAEAPQVVRSEQRFRTINVKKLISRLTDLDVLERLLNMNFERDSNYVTIESPVPQKPERRPRVIEKKTKKPKGGSDVQ